MATWIGHSDGPPEDAGGATYFPPPPYPPPPDPPPPPPPSGGAGTGRPVALQLSRSDRLPLLAGIAACMGVAIGCTGPWVDVAVFSIGGLDAGPWGKVWIGVATVSAVILTVLLATERLQLQPQIALATIWGVFVAAVTCAAFSVPYVIRILTLPKADFFGLRMGAQIGWGLWLLVVSAGVLAGASAVAAGRVGRACDAIASSWRLPSVTRRYREVAVGLAVVVTLGWAGYYWATWNGGLPGSDSVASERRSGSEWPFGEQRDRESSSSAPTSTAAAGEEIQLGGLQLEVPGIWLQRVIGTGRSPLSTHEPRGIWVVAPIRVTNTSSEKQATGLPQVYGRPPTETRRCAQRPGSLPDDSPSGG
jgi:hypothetical protein